MRVVRIYAVCRHPLDTESSIRQGCEYFSELLAGRLARLRSGQRDSWYAQLRRWFRLCRSHGGKYSFELAQAFAEEKSGGACYLQE